MSITINGNGTISGVSVGGLPDGIVDTDMLAANAVSAAKLASGAGGKVLQIVQSTFTGRDSQSVGSGATWIPTNPKCSITPSNANNKILVQANITVALAQNSHGMYLTVLKAGSPIFRGDADGSNMERTTVGTYSHNDYNFGTMLFNYLDTAGSAGSPIEYSIRLSHDSGSSTTIYLNRTEATDNVDDRKRGASNIILTELAV